MKSFKRQLNFLNNRLLMAVLVVPAFVLLSGCSDDPDPRPYFKLGYYDEEAREIHAPIEGIQDDAVYYNVYSNVSWYADVQYLIDEEMDWLDIWPKNGSGDGRFRVKVAENDDTPYVRQAEIYIVVDGYPTDTLRVTQDPVAARLEIGMEGLTRLSFRSYESAREAILNTNVVWEAEIVGGGDWLEFGEATRTTQEFSVESNPYTVPREASVIFRSKGVSPELETTLTILQRDSSGDPENGTKKTIREILDQTGGIGDIDGNVYIEGWVTSDYTTRNLNVMRNHDILNTKGSFDPETQYERRLMYVMDETGALMCEFLGAGMNTFPLNAKIKLHLIDQTFLTDAYSGSIKIGNLDSDSVFEWEESTGIEPVRIPNMDNLDQYANHLVTIDPVQFALPFGTYFNVDERFQDVQFSIPNLWNSYKYVETPRQYGHIIVDGNGNSVKLMTDCTFTERFAREIPRGSGPLTALVTREKDKITDEVINVLRIRNDADNQVSADENSRLSKPVVRFGPYIRNIEELPKIVDDIQGAQLKTSVYTNLGSSAIYWSYTYGRIEPTEIYVDERTGIQEPVVPQPTDVSSFVYACLNANNMYNSSVGTSINDANGEAWIITFSTKDVTGDLWLCFNNSSSQSGPGSLDTEWSTSENTPVDEWKEIGRHYCPNWDTNYHLNQFFYKLPDEMKGLNRVVIRMRSVENLRARRNNQTVSSAGTNRIGQWWLEERK